MKPVRLTAHAQTVAVARGIDPLWIEAVVRAPEWTEPDRIDAGAVRFFGRPSLAPRVLRAVCVETDAEIRVITVFFDRDAKRPA